MVKNRNLMILAGVLVVLLAINVFQKLDHRRSTNRSTTDVLVAGPVTADQLERIVIGHGETSEAVVLTSGPTGWLVASAYNAPANQGRIDTLLRNLDGLGGEFRAESAAVLADFGLDDASAVTIRASGDGDDIALDVGRSPERASGNFVRLPDSDRVYLTQVNVLSSLGIYGEPETPKSTHFVDLQCVKLDREEVDRIVITDGGSVWEMAKEYAVIEPAADDTTGAVAETDHSVWEWNLVRPRAESLAKTKADAVLGALVNIRAVDVDDPAAVPADYGLEDPARVAAIHLRDGTEKVLEFGATRPAEGDLQTGIWMRIRGEREIWVVTDYTVGNIFKSPDELKPE